VCSTPSFSSLAPTFAFTWAASWLAWPAACRLTQPITPCDRLPFVPISDRILMGPGPSNPYPEVMQALARPVVGHLDPDFLAVLDETCDRLRSVFRTSNELTLPVSGTGSAGMETAFVNVIGPSDTVVVGVNGLFGERMCDVATRCGADLVRVDE